LRGQDFEVLPWDQTQQERSLKALAEWARTYKLATILGMESLMSTDRQIVAFVIEALLRGVYGAGDPLLLVHGNGGSIATLSDQIAHFRKRYKVIAIVQSRPLGGAGLSLLTSRSRSRRGLR
jgi:pimeloyl-ACP methyl ester carboxylesterase